ncbi:MAG: radical SAM protein [Elusimicrobia bacterium]|nr:radical SAM protein [Elusimicrobiota bacterium]
MEFEYCYGPVGSWRLGVSLGVDPVSRPEKICDFNCVYCQIGSVVPLPPSRKNYISSRSLSAELEKMKAPADYVTFSGRGEPTMASNLPGLLSAARKKRSEKMAIITNSSLLADKKVRDQICSFDMVIAKLDAPKEELFREINRPHPSISFDEMVKGLIIFSGMYRQGRLAIQTMFIEENRNCVEEMCSLYAKINPEEVQLNTPTRPCGRKPLDQADMSKITSCVKNCLEGLGKGDIKVISVYEEKRPHVIPLSADSTLKRRGKI